MIFKIIYKTFDETEVRIVNIRVLSWFSRICDIVENQWLSLESPFLGIDNPAYSQNISSPRFEEQLSIYQRKYQNIREKILEH
ncbi:unnamed protein product [Paramecium primaurelia]|uniref:Uncharacterized protein n=1 Tax=Paramecium primaurelia TaxID=5886 RepID=A0A8S1NYD6_PARPR|nr:unnamed protein product [Paramecium primaurelia]